MHDEGVGSGGVGGEFEDFLAAGRQDDVVKAGAVCASLLFVATFERDLDREGLSGAIHQRDLDATADIALDVHDLHLGTRLADPAAKFDGTADLVGDALDEAGLDGLLDAEAGLAGERAAADDAGDESRDDGG
jgi:hypothetical protein